MLKPSIHHPSAMAGQAAAYVRMSTDHQQYSIDNQMQVISDYALSRGLEIVRTYSDAGRSGLSLQGRDALRQLIADVRAGRAQFAFVLVYDVSRWGRFQDIDESAHYEFICRNAGVEVEYCADGFQNDGTMLATLIKAMKRVMAGEFSGELSTKVFEAQIRLVKKGFHQGGTPGFGLRRILVDHKGRRKGVMQPGERKNFQSERVILAPGPEEEVRVVREIFRLYAKEQLSHRQIARRLNKQGTRTERGNQWSQHGVAVLLGNERYIGNLVYNRTSLKLQSKRHCNPESRWVRSPAALQPIVDPEVFASAKGRLKAGWEIGDNDLLKPSHCGLVQSRLSLMQKYAGSTQHSLREHVQGTIWQPGKRISSSRIHSNAQLWCPAGRR
jgi:DNA invertase Pin-like site-specific DNA recombinase